MLFSCSIQLCALKREWRPVVVKQTSLAGPLKEEDELRKIKKVQSFFRGWLCRRRWKQIVEEYIKSPHAESMRKRNRYKHTRNKNTEMPLRYLLRRRPLTHPHTRRRRRQVPRKKNAAEMDVFGQAKMTTFDKRRSKKPFK